MRAIVLFISVFLSSLPLAGANKKRDFATVTKLQAIEDVGPELYWLDRTGTIHKYFSVLETQRNPLPFISLFGNKHNERLKNGIVQELDSGDAWISDISADSDNGLIALDSRHNRILQVPTGTQRSWSVLVPPNSLRQPVAVVLKSEFIYVLDKSNSGLQVFKAQNGSLVQTLSLVPPFPDTLIAGDHELVGMNYSARTVLRFLISDKSSPIPEGRIVGIQTTVLSSLEEPIDLAVMGSVYYILDRGRNQLAVWSPVMGDLTFTPYNPFASAPVAIATAGAHLFFADNATGTFQVLQRVEAADFLFNGQDVSVGLVKLYQYLYKNGLLPQQEYRVQSGDTLEGIVSSKGLLPAGFTNAFKDLFCKLNSTSCTDSHPSLKLGSVVILPNLPLQVFVGKKYVDLDALQRASKRVFTLAERLTSDECHSKYAGEIASIQSGVVRCSIGATNYGQVQRPSNNCENYSNDSLRGAEPRQQLAHRTEREGTNLSVGWAH